MIYEKKTEEYANNKYCKFCKDLRFCNNNKCSKWDNTYTDYLNGLVEGRKEGYEQGYEDCRHYAHDYYKPKWHDLRKNPDDLPKEDYTEVMFVTENKNETLAGIYMNGSSIFGTFGIAFYDVEQVIAWCELPKFKE